METAYEWLPPAEKRCDTTKVNVTRSRSASFADGMTARRTLASIRKESADARRPPNFCARRKASEPPRIDASTDPWRVIQGVNPPPVHAGSREGFIRFTFFANASRGRESLK